MLNFQKLTRCITVLGAKVFAVTTAGISGTDPALKLIYKILTLSFSKQVKLRKLR